MKILPFASFYHYFMILGSFLGLVPFSFSQNVNIGTPPIRNFSNKVYQAGTQNWDAAQNSHGVMFWANNEGLLQYDGTTWKCTPVSNHTIVRSVAIDSSDRIYIGAQGELGYFSPMENGKLSYTSLVSLLPLDQRNFEDIWDISFVGDDVFFRTNHAVLQYTMGKMKSHQQEGEISSMFTVGSDLMIQKNLSELLVLKDGGFQSLLLIPALQSAITGVMEWRGDTLIMSSLKHGLFYLKNNKVARWYTPNDKLLMDKRIYSATVLLNGNLALGTSLDGLLVIDGTRRALQHLTKKKGLQNNNVLHTFSDRTGNVWLGLDNGIDCIDLDSPFSTLFPDGEMQATGYSAATYKNHLYLGVSNGAYVAPWRSYYDPEKEPFFTKINSTDGQVWSFNSLGDVLIMGHHEGSFQVSPTYAKQLSSDPGAWTFVSMSDEYMIGGTYMGLVLYHKVADEWIFDRSLEGLNESCRILVKDEDDMLWVSHPYRGVYQIKWSPENKYILKSRFFNQENGLPSNLNNYVFLIAGKAVFTTEKGVFHYDYLNDRFIPAEDFNRLLGTESRVRYLKEDTRGNVWYANEQEVGILMVDDFGLKKEVQKIIFPELSGKLVGGFEFIHPIDDRNIIFGTEQGFIHFALDINQQPDTLLQIIFSYVQAGGADDSLLFEGNLPLRDDRNPMIEPVLQSGMNTLSFSYSATEYNNPALVEYRVKLLGLDKNWSNWSPETKKNYTNLSPGKYTFQVQARLKNKYTSDIISYTLRIRPPWYKSSPALSIYGLAFLGIFIGFVLRQRRKFEKEKAEMAESHQQKEAAHRIVVEQSKAALTEIQNEKLGAEINYKNQELALTTMHLVQKAEILLTVQAGLNHILEKSPTPGVKKEIQQLINLLNFDVKLDEDWEHFALHFDQVHVNFIKHLREQFPQLSANDYKLCAYLRMNLSTKEIAPLMNISVRGVEGSRYRLRRKLDLPNDANLTEFILQLPSNPISKPN